eukprot:Blabericola_migrator_1__7667@NODE_3913_length_1429_cov_5_849486_g2417_i0_p1_GENE_NODE_3913_length_1429_cov_5_849486_g2417_i0NODE_3913_length_1429_cov_5_849486_g2417_i0_p1_ORF_typecomplete_len166_score20_21_NODE_3913_length_1429_cov_5_849486_g2417_i0466963
MFERCSTPDLWNTMKQLLNQAESAVANRCFSTAELQTVIQVQKSAIAYAADPEAAACAAHATKIRSQQWQSREAPQHVDKSSHSHNVSEGRRQPSEQQPPTPHEDLKAATSNEWSSLGARPKKPLPVKRLLLLTLAGQMNEEQHKAEATSKDRCQGGSLLSAMGS